MKNCKKTKGFTLIEVLISLLLLTIILVGGIMLYVNADQIMALASHKKIATQLASSRMEQVKMQDFNTIHSESAVTVQIGGLNGQRTLTVADVDESSPPDGVTDYKRVDVSLTWFEVDRNVPRTVALRTMVSP